jgi:formamidopyrimidine-DNA glycosylase
MPELPEVEITRRTLQPHLVGRCIEAVVTAPRSYFFLTPPNTLKRNLIGRTVVSLDRHGKYLLARLDDHSTLLLHLGMTGQLFAADARNAGRPSDHIHLRLRFVDRGLDVLFRDVRKFGKVKWLAPGKQDKRLSRLGADALTATAEDLRAAASKRRASIKALLLDQSVLAGIGNIYADEALFLSQVRPTRSARRVSVVECERLIANTHTVMRQAIKAGGSTIRDFIAADGKAGSYQDRRLVYGRTGEPCPRCKTTIRRIVLATRSTHYCPQCQK